MNTLLIFFAFPVAVIILAAVLQTVLRSPVSVAAVFFAVFLVITFAFFDANFLIATIVYTILAFLSAALVKLIERLIRKQCNNLATEADEENDIEENDNNDICFGRNFTDNNPRRINYRTRENIYKYCQR